MVTGGPPGLSLSPPRTRGSGYAPFDLVEERFSAAQAIPNGSAPNGECAMYEFWEGGSGKLRAAFGWPWQDVCACGTRLLKSANNGEKGAGDWKHSAACWPQQKRDSLCPPCLSSLNTQHTEPLSDLCVEAVLATEDAEALVLCNVSSLMKSARRGIRFPAPSGVPQGGIAQGVRSCEKMDNLTQRRQGAKDRKGKLLCFFCAF